MEGVAGSHTVPATLCGLLAAAAVLVVVRLLMAAVSSVACAAGRLVLMLEQVDWPRCRASGRRAAALCGGGRSWLLRRVVL